MCKLGAFTWLLCKSSLWFCDKGKKKKKKPLYSASANVTIKEVACFCLSVEFGAVMTLGVFNFSHQRTKYSLSFERGCKDSVGFVQSNFVNIHLT